MLNKVRKISFLFILVLLIVGCNPKQEGSEMDQEYKTLTFNGEGETWEFKNYQLEVSPIKFFSGNDVLSMKNTTEYFSNFLSFGVHAEINGSDHVIHSYSQLGENNIAYKEMGTSRSNGSPYVDKNGKPLTINDYKNLYLLIEWEDPQGNPKNEKIQLEQ